MWRDIAITALLTLAAAAIGTAVLAAVAALAT